MENNGKEAIDKIAARLRAGETVMASELTAIAKAYPELVESKYFTPSIEDIRVGYEYEEASEGRPGYPNWLKGKVGDFEEAELIISEKLPRNSIRVPYLTKEQIEAEGWENKTDLNELAVWGNYTFIKGEAKCSFFYLENYITISPKTVHINKMKLYTGECKDINTFRMICKLLGI